jgi:hypothetical protein
MPLNWNEIKHRAVEFSHEWEGAFSEDADAKPFLVSNLHFYDVIYLLFTLLLELIQTG